jgi:hypothetical protein
MRLSPASACSYWHCTVGVAAEKKARRSPKLDRFHNPPKWRAGRGEILLNGCYVTSVPINSCYLGDPPFKRSSEQYKLHTCDVSIWVRPCTCQHVKATVSPSMVKSWRPELWHQNTNRRKGNLSTLVTSQSNNKQYLSRLVATVVNLTQLPTKLTWYTKTV